MFEVLDKIYVASTIRESIGKLPAVIQISEEPLFERSSIFIPEATQISPFFDCMYKDAPELYKCDSCGFQVYLKVNLKVHMEMVHELNIPMSSENFCSFSDENYNLSNILKCYNCEHCDFTTYSLLVLLNHQLKQHKSVRKMICLKKPKRVNPILNQRKPREISVTSKQINDKWFDCELCSFVSKCKYRLKYHIQRNHRLPEDERLYECNKCSFQTINESKLKLHRLQHDESQGNELFKCNLCSHRTKNKHLLNSHVMFKHTEEEKVRRFNCSYCPYKAKQKSTLNMHIMAKHTSEEKINWFLCEMCSFRCKRRTHLKQHMIKHSDNKLILCEMCSAQFKRVGNLKQHMRCKHKIKM